VTGNETMTVARAAALISVALSGAAFGQGAIPRSVKPAQATASLKPDTKLLPNLKVVPITVTIPNGPANIEHGGGADNDYFCTADANVVTPTTCSMTATLGSPVNFHPAHNYYFERFTSNQPGCNGATCYFIASTPASIVAHFTPTSQFFLDFKVSPGETFFVTSDKKDAVGGQALQCPPVIDDSLSKGAANCVAVEPRNTVLTVTVTYRVGTGALQPLPSERFSGPCVSTAVGKCTIKMSDLKMIAMIN
jgi:hypothetical protein